MYTSFTVRIIYGLTLFLLATLSTTLQAQVYTHQVGVGTKSIYQYGPFGPDGAVPTSTLQSVDTAPLIAEDQERAKLGLPARLGVDVTANVDLIQTGVKSAKSGYQVSIYKFEVPDALGLSVVFDELKLADSARLFIYNADLTVLIGPITAKQNGQNFWSDLLEGSTVMVEVQEPAQAVGQSRVHVSKLVQYYRFAPRFGFGTSAPCEKNTICYPAYQNEADGVTMLLINFSPNTYACTGSIVNSTQQDFRSYLLTAFHCYDFSGNGVQSAAEQAAIATTQVRFHWESPTCATVADNVYLTLTGANFRAAYANSDLTLIELIQQIPPSENITYLGWDRTSTVPSSPFGIHHPAADVKKISFSPNATTLVNVTPGASYVVNTGTTHLQVTWAASPNNLGVTEGGSSGSPLFNSSRRIVGQLHGGGSFCNSPTSPDQYGRFFTSWTGGSTNATRLSNWLDPTSLGNTTTNGIRPTISGLATITDAGSFTLNTLVSSIASWTITGGAGAVATTSGTGNVANVVVLSTANSLTITYSVNAGQSYPIQFSQEFNVVKSCTLSSITTQPPSSSNVAVGANVQIQVATSGPVTSYQWYRGATSLTGQTSSTLTLTNVQLSDAGAYSVVVTGSCNSVTSTAFSLAVTPIPDLTPILYARPSSVYGTTTISLVVDVTELNSAPTNGPLTIYVTKDPRSLLSFNSSTASLNNRPVQNSAWNFDDTSNSSFYILTTSQVIEADGVLSFGLRGTLIPGATKGVLTLSAIIDDGSGGEVKLTNNSDADKMTYFQK